MISSKQTCRPTLVKVRQAKDAAQKDGLLDLYRVAATREQQLIETLKAMESDAANE
jgi:hypothetical protein